MTAQQKLEAITHFGPGDIRTLKLSEQRDKEIEQAIYERYKRCIA